MKTSSLQDLLTPFFLLVHATSALHHFVGMSDDFQKGKWEDSMAKGGKFIEASLKALYGHANLPRPAGTFKVDTYINGLTTSPAAGIDKAIRITIPRACRFVYEIASNRGGRHDADEVDPNEIDANAVVTNCSWILAEMIRHAQKGTTSGEVKELVASLVRRRYSLIENVEGRVYFHGKKRSGVDISLVVLFYRYPRRMTTSELIAALHHNGIRETNARMSIQRIRRLVDIDGSGGLLLLTTGLSKAEAILGNAAS